MTADALTARVAAGDPGAIARMLTRIERRSAGLNDDLARLHLAGGDAHVIGVTGAAGSGKSTLVAALTERYRAAGRSVGVLAVDPSSALTGGAILGDRIRMSGLAGDPGVYIRSIATRGALGGLSRAALDAVTVLSAAGKDVVILETVGVGQAEVDVLGAAQTVVVVSVPGMGDDVQAIKAGLLEVADVHVVNKSDRDGADRTVAELREMLRLSRRRPGQWNVPIAQTAAATGAGVAELIGELDRHRAWLAGSDELARRARRSAATRMRWMAEELVLSALADGEPEFESAVAEVAARRDDPAGAARRLLARIPDLVAAAPPRADTDDGSAT